MKAIILGAGYGSRLGNFAKELPKSLVDINGKSIIKRQIETFRNNGIKDIIVIVGPNKDKFQLNNIEYVVDKNFHEHEQLGSLMVANKHFQNDIVISFGDVIVDDNIMKQVIESTYDIGVAIDLKWEKNYENRTQHPKSEADLALMLNLPLILDVGYDSHNFFPILDQLQPQCRKLIQSPVSLCCHQLSHHQMKSLYHSENVC